MANLNFQQPPRSIATTSLSNRNSGSFGGSSLSGHVTPTSGMFPQNNASYQPSQQPQLSPNRSIQLSGNGAPPQISSTGRNSIFGQRSFQQDRRPMQGIGGSMVRINYCPNFVYKKRDNNFRFASSVDNCRQQCQRSCKLEAMVLKVGTVLIISIQFLVAVQAILQEHLRCLISLNFHPSRTREEMTHYLKRMLCNRLVVNPTVNINVFK